MELTVAVVLEKVFEHLDVTGDLLACSLHVLLIRRNAAGKR